MSGRDDIKIDNMEDIKYYRLAVQLDDISHEWLINKGLTEDTHFIMLLRYRLFMAIT
jgi:hypothetical protein